MKTCRWAPCLVALTVVLAVGLAPTASAAGPKVLVVPSGAYPSVQSAVNAAAPGDRIRVLPGTYREQVTIAKSLTIVGSGPGVTTIAAPQTLVAGEDGKNSIVEIRNHASVAMSLIGVSGPGTGTCDDAALGAGIRVLSGAHLDLRFARVAHIRNSPTVPCFRSGDAIAVGIITDPDSGTAVIRDSEIVDYGGKGILILSAGPATITRNIVTGPAQMPADGIDALFSASTITYNLITGNVCPTGNASCGNDPVNDVQKMGILAGGVPGAVVTNNVAVGNQVGLYGFGGGDLTIAHNLLLNNKYFGMELQDGSFVANDDRILGGVVGVVSLALGADTHVQLNHELIVVSGPPVQTAASDGFTATVSRQP